MVCAPRTVMRGSGERSFALRAVPAWLVALCVLTAAIGVLHLSTGDIVRGAIFAIAGVASLVANVVAASRRARPTDGPPGRTRFAGEGLRGYLMRWALVTGAAGAALSIPVLVNGSVASGSASGWLLFAAGLIAIYLALEILALWRTARSIPSMIAHGEHIGVMCTGRHAGIGGLFGAGVVAAATNRRLIVASRSSNAGKTYRSFAYSDLGKCEVGEGGRLTLQGGGLTLALTAVHPKCGHVLAQAVENRVAQLHL